jgi:hypothetical protein
VAGSINPFAHGDGNVRTSGYDSNLVPLLLFLGVLVATLLLLYMVTELVTDAERVIEELLG